MVQLISFTFITLNGFYKGEHEETGWHQHQGEAAKFADEASGSDNILLFGRKTYDMMAGFWPTPMAHELYPIVAENMNKARKIVCSNTMKKADWHNTEIISGDIIRQLAELKRTSKNDMTILGSGSLLTQLTDAGLIDNYLIMLDPVALGSGTPIFNGLKNETQFKLNSCRAFENDGIVLLNYGISSQL